MVKGYDFSKDKKNLLLVCTFKNIFKFQIQMNHMCSRPTHPPQTVNHCLDKLHEIDNEGRSNDVGKVFAFTESLIVEAAINKSLIQHKQKFISAIQFLH